jgi:hypothetical protein
MKRSSKESQARLFAIAEAQGGFFTAKQAEDAGFDRTHHAYHLRVGNWQRKHRGIYRLAQFPARPHAATARCAQQPRKGLGGYGPPHFAWERWTRRC